LEAMLIATFMSEIKKQQKIRIKTMIHLFLTSMLSNLLL